MNSYRRYTASDAADTWRTGTIQFSWPKLNRPIHEAFHILGDPDVD